MRLWIVIFSLVATAVFAAESVEQKSQYPKLEVEAKPDLNRAALTNVELGLGYLELGQVARAKTKLVLAIKQAPKIPETHAAMAHFLEVTGDYREAEKEHKKTIRLSSTKGQCYNNYGNFLCRRARFEEADKAFLESIKDKEYIRTAEVFENAGICALNNKSIDKAKEYFKTSIMRDPRRDSALLGLIESHLESGEVREAESYFERFRSHKEPTARSLWLGIQIARQTKNENLLASQALLLKSLFEDSKEYAWYLQSEVKS